MFDQLPHQLPHGWATGPHTIPPRAQACDGWDRVRIGLGRYRHLSCSCARHGRIGWLAGPLLVARIFSGLMLRDAVVDRAASKPSRGQVQSWERGRPLSQRPVPVDL
jgi:hypothetical protein